VSPIELRDDLQQRNRVANGPPAIWILVLIDLTVFAILFLAFFQSRASQRSAFDAAQAHLSAPLGLINVVVLLTSSLFVVMAVNAARDGQAGATARALLYAAICGVVFLLIKVVEYTLKFSVGSDVFAGDFFMFYVVLTGLHALHVIAGVAMLGVLRIRAARGRYVGDRVSVIESGAIYWHMVDLLWVLIFPLLYLAR
jgi:nitric oxide reductase NorE protein